MASCWLLRSAGIPVKEIIFQFLGINRGARRAGRDAGIIDILQGVFLSVENRLVEFGKPRPAAVKPDSSIGIEVKRGNERHEKAQKIGAWVSNGRTGRPVGEQRVRYASGRTVEAAVVTINALVEPNEITLLDRVRPGIGKKAALLV